MVKDKNSKEKERTIVRLKTDYFNQGNSVCIKKSLTVLKRKSNGLVNLLDFLQEEPTHMECITNLHEVEDGVYELITHNERFMNESEYPEDWDYMLIPYEEDSPND